MREEVEGVNEGEADFKVEMPSVLEAGRDRGFSATSFEAVRIWSLRVNTVAGDVVVDASNNTLI